MPSGLQQDLRYTLRSLRRNPGFVAVAVSTLALGIGASTALFTIVDSVLVRPLRFPEPERLTAVWMRLGPDFCCSRVSSAYLHEWRLQSDTLDDLAGWYDDHVNLTGRGEPLEIEADRVTVNFFDVLATPALIGRTFASGADLRDVGPEVVLTYGFWQRHYGGDRSVIGRTMTLDGETFTIIGVMPEGFAIRTLELAESRAELWLPFSLIPADARGILSGVARLAPGATLDEARAELAVISARVQDERSFNERDWTAELLPLHEATVRQTRQPLLVLFGAVGILLLIACVNVANLLLGRASVRQTELAIRVSLGATRGRLLCQLLTESVLLAAVSAACGVLLAVAATRYFVSVLPAAVDLPRLAEIRMDLRALGFAVAVATLTAILFGLVPWMASWASEPRSGLRNVIRGTVSPAGGRRFGSALVISEMALALLLLAGAGLLGRSFWELSRVDPGFDPEGVLTFRTTLPVSRYDSRRRLRAFHQKLLTRIDHLPDVRAVGSVNYLPMGSSGRGQGFTIAGRRNQWRPEDRPFSWTSIVGGSYFDAMGIPLLRGRLPDESDAAETGPVFVIDETLARRYWPEDDPIGARITWVEAGGGAGPSGEVIGIVGSVRWMGMAARPPGMTYFWFPQRPEPQITTVARTLGDPSAMAGRIAALVVDVDPLQPVAEIRTLRDVVSDDLAHPRVLMLLLGGFAGAAVLLAGIGLYGVIAFAVSRRTREIGVRIALGARYDDVLGLVFKRGAMLSGAGLAIGVAAALASGRLVAALLYGVPPADPATLVAAALALAVVAMLATWLPARRAARVDPVFALRCE